MTAVPFELAENQKLAPWTTLGLGGESRWYTRAQSEEDLLAALRWAKADKHPWMILGDGSNLVVGDAGFDGLTIHVDTRGIEVDERSRDVILDVQAGESWDPLVALATRCGWAGLECLSGIPGRVGATPVQNVGAYGQDVSETISSVRVYDADQDEIQEWSNHDCKFGYRDSAFKRVAPGRYVVLSVHFRLRRNGKPTVLYNELRHALGDDNDLEPGPAGLERVRETVLELRRGKAMVIDPEDPNSRSAGSFFTNPIVDVPFAEELAKRFPTMPRFVVTSPTGEQRSKLAAAWLIERAGFEKGLRLGAVGISEKHALALVHYGGGSTNDLLDLAQRIRMGVHETFGVLLTPEPRLVGCALPGIAPHDRP